MTEDEIREDERQRLADIFEVERLRVLSGPHPNIAPHRIIASVLDDVVNVLRFNGDGLTQNTPRGMES